jgi:hypothetical protein
MGLRSLPLFDQGHMMTHIGIPRCNTKQPPPSADNEMGIIGRRVDLACRYFITFLMLLYGLVKVFQGQFYTDEYWRDTSLRSLDGM